MSSNWTDELRKEVCALWNKQSASQIVIWLNRRGYTFSRNAVIGVIHRAGLSTKSKTNVHWATTSRNGAPRHRVAVHTGELNHARARALAPNAKAEPFVCAAASDIVPLNLLLTDLQEGDCRWPYDAAPGASISHVFCGHPSIEGRPYCRGHTAIATAGLPPRRQSLHPAEFGKNRGGVFGRVA